MYAANATPSKAISSSSSTPELPWAFTDCSTDTLIILISHMLNLLMQHNDQVVLTPDALTRFHSRAAPGISVLEYLRRIVKYTNMETIPLLSLLAYIDITCQHLPTFTLSSLTVHRFLIAGVCAGSKAQCDVFCTNAHYAKVGGIKAQELNALEREFLKVTEWNLCCNADLLQRYYTSLIRSHGGYVQASAPEESPFLPFPHSDSRPPSPALSETGADGEEGDDEMLGQGESSRPESEYESAEQDVKRNLSGVGLAVDQRDTHPSPLLARGSAKRWSSRQMWNAGMELDPPGTSPYSIATSSSIPSSSRSSLRASRPPPTGRTVSLSYSDPKLAEPKVEKTTSSGEGVPWETEVGEEDKEDKEDMGNEHHGGHLLRNLVGGMFRRKSHSYRPPRAATEAGIITAFTSKLPSIPHPRSSAPEPPPPDGTITHISPSARAVRSSPVRSPPHARSPGIAMAVTPRVRTRDERRVESFNRDRVGIGSAADGGGPGVVVGDREERRARLD